ncbi:MAG: substrate-binding domain-containing protein, partial [Actinobacteria bacterium]|nr:substrate-binding domain-containing protein [Actinomycetota bacterium]
MSKHEQFAESIESEISSGGLRAGDAIPSIRSIMKSSSLGMSTVARGLKILEKRGVIRCHARRGYFVQETKHTDRALNSRQVAFVTPVIRETTNAYAKGLTEGIRGQDRVLVVHCSLMDGQRYRLAMKHLIELPPGGIVILPLPQGVCPDEFKSIAAKNIPCVVIGSGVDDQVLDCDRVFKGVQIGAEKLCQYLLDRGYREFQLLLTTPHVAPGRDVFQECVHQWLEDRGAKITGEYIYDPLMLPHLSDYSLEALIKDYKDFVSSLLTKGERLKMLICNDDYAALGAIAALEERGLKVPDDVAVASGLRGEGLPFGIPDFTTIDYHRELMGRLAGQVLKKRMEGGEGPPEIHHVGGELIVGQT